MFPSYRNQSIDLQNKSIDWFLYDESIGHLRVNLSFLSMSGEMPLCPPILAF